MSASWLLTGTEAGNRSLMMLLKKESFHLCCHFLGGGTCYCLGES